MLRKRLGRDPTAQEVVTALESNERFRASADEILQACDEGREMCFSTRFLVQNHDRWCLGGSRMVHEMY